MAGPNPDTLKNIFYEATDGEFKFNNGKTIKINKALLGARHRTFYEMFFKNTQNIVEIKDFDFDIFKLFLECFMGFKKCTETDALLILPIAVKYQLDEFLNKLVEILKPKELNEALCISLNLATFYNITALSDILLDFLHKEFQNNQLLEKENLYFLLEPESMLILLNYVEMDSYIYKILFKWGNNYISKNNKNITLRKFFEECKISETISLDTFETTESILKFTESGLGSNFFTDSEILNYLRRKIYSEEKSEWMKIKDGEKIEEIFTVDNLYLPKDYTVYLFFKRNEAAFYALPISKNVAHLIDYEIIWKYTDDKSVEDFNFESINADELCQSFKCEYFKIKIKEAGEECLLKEIRIIYTFNADSRILKKSEKFNMALSFKNDLLYFTNDIFYKMEKRVPIKEEIQVNTKEPGASNTKTWSFWPEQGFWNTKPTQPTQPSQPAPTTNEVVNIPGSTTRVVWRVKPTSPLMKTIKDIKKEG